MVGKDHLGLSADSLATAIVGRQLNIYYQVCFYIFQKMLLILAEQGSSQGHFASYVNVRSVQILEQLRLALIKKDTFLISKVRIIIFECLNVW